MMRPLHIDLPADHRRLVLDILRAHLPRRTKTWVFGSRVTGRARRYSDLDLAIDAGRRLTLDEIARLAEAFSDSDLALPGRSRRLAQDRRPLAADNRCRAHRVGRGRMLK
jgi:predicted nucleotidyltransferase